MSKNCLLSQLKETVSNYSLPWYYGMKVSINTPYSSTTGAGGYIGVSDAAKVSVNGGTPVSGRVPISSGSSVSFTHTGDIYILVKEANSKYYFQSVGGLFDKSAVDVTIKDFIYGASIVGATVIDVNLLHVMGDISEFAKYRMTTISIRTTGDFLYGTLEELIEKYYARTDYAEKFVGNSLSVYIPNAGVTFHETAISTGLNCVFNANSVSITNASTSELIATYDGSSWTYV